MSGKIGSQAQYGREAAAYYEPCNKAKLEQAQELIKDYVITIVSDLDSGGLVRKLGHVKLLQEPGRKMWVHDLLVGAPVKWSKIKTQHKS